MTNPKDHVFDLIYGRFRSQILYAGVELGVFETVTAQPIHAVELADKLDIDRDAGYRLLRALGSLGLLKETADRRFSITPGGELLREDHPESLHGHAHLNEGPTHYAIWKHLLDVVSDGGPNGFQREFGHSVFEHMEADPAYAQAFNTALSSMSRLESAWTLEMLDGFDFSEVSHVCDVAGGYGHLLSSLLKEHPQLEGTVLELPHVVEADDQLVAPKMSVDDRCSYVAGDMFEAVPEADVYLMKQILHDWTNEECKQILSTIRDSATTGTRLFSVEFVVPEPDTSHFAKLMDIHMMVATDGRERTSKEYAALYEDAGWEYVETRYPENERMGAVEGVAI